MKPFLLTLLTFAIISCSPLIQRTAEPNPPFETQGEQEDFWAQELFKNEYKKEEYPRYSGNITTTINRIYFENDWIEVLGKNSEFQQMFEQGILYPSLFGQYELKFGDLEQLYFLSDNPRVKRFRFIHYERTLLDTKLANPQVYLFELENENIKGNEPLSEFVESAKLTFLKAGWIMN